MTYTVNDERMSVLPIAVVMGYASCDARMNDFSQLETIGEVLERKRQDEHYPKIIESLVTNGWTTGIHITPGECEISDGHHRLAAAIDLGQQYVPVVSDFFSAEDSGAWGKTDNEWF